MASPLQTVALLETTIAPRTKLASQVHDNHVVYLLCHVDHRSPKIQHGRDYVFLLYMTCVFVMC